MFGQHYCHDRDGDSALKLHHQKLPVSGNQTGSTSCFIDGCGTLTFTVDDISIYSPPEWQNTYNKTHR